MNSADYKYRAFISKAKVAARMMLKTTEINYDNFKNSVKEIARKNAYSNVWMELRKLQNKLTQSFDISSYIVYLTLFISSLFLINLLANIYNFISSRFSFFLT